MKKYIFYLALFLLIILLFINNFNQNKNSNIDSVKNFWYSMHDYMQILPGKVFGKDSFTQDHYPAQAAISLLSAYLITKDEVFAKDAERQLEYAHSFENKDNLFVSYAFNFEYVQPQICREHLSRHIYSLYAGYKILGDKKYLEWADNNAAAMLNFLKRDKTFFKQKTYNLFYTCYHAEPPYNPYIGQGVFIVPNQNASLGMAFTLLYHDPNSKFYKSKILKDFAYTELRASMALQEDDGTILLPIGIGGHDTLYGTYTSFSWAVANHFWQNLEFEKHIKKAGKWLKQYSTGQAIGIQCWRRFCGKGDLDLLEEIFGRIPVLYTTNNLKKEFIDYGYSLMQDKKLILEELQYITREIPFCFFEIIDIPKNVYLY